MPFSAATAATEAAVLLVPAPTISWAERSAQALAQTSMTACFLALVEGGRLGRRAQRHDARRPGVEEAVHEPLQRRQRHLAPGLERRHRGDVHTPQTHVPRHATKGTLPTLWRCPQRNGSPARSRARVKILSSISSVSLPVKVFC